MHPRQFLMIVSVIAMTAVCVPCDSKDLPLMVKGLTTGATVAITGNSVLSHASKCDEDPRSIPRIVADEIQQPALDLSFPGQSVDEAVLLAATALRNPSIETVVFPVSLFAMQEWDTDPIRLYALSRLLHPDLPMAGLAARAASGGRFSGTPFHSEAAFDYDGRRYPNYEAVKTTYFDPEKSLMPCPENDGADVGFITAYYHHGYLEYPLLAENIALIASLNEQAAALRKTLLLVILPIDYELIERLGVKGGATLRQRTAAVIAALAGQGVRVLDLSSSMPNTGFADRWCACGHLLSSGRNKVAARIANALPEPVRAVAAQ